MGPCRTPAAGTASPSKCRTSKQLSRGCAKVERGSATTSSAALAASKSSWKTRPAIRSNSSSRRSRRRNSRAPTEKEDLDLMPYERDPRVDHYIDALPAWQRELCQQLRDLIHAADPEITETIKRTVQPYFVLAGNVCALLAASDHANLFLYDGAMVPDPVGITTGGPHHYTAMTRSAR